MVIRDRLIPGADRILYLTYRPTLFDCPLGDVFGKFLVLEAEESPGVPRRQFTSFQFALDSGRKLKQTKRVGNGRPALAYPGADLLMGKSEVFEKLLIGGGFLEWAEVLALEILH